MENSNPKNEIGQAMNEVSAALFEMRDALMELSLALKDWQFETDLARRNNAEHKVKDLLEKIKAGQNLEP